MPTFDFYVKGVSLITTLVLLLAVPAASAQGMDDEFKPLVDAIITSCSQAQVKRITVADFTDLQGQVTELGRFVAEEISGSLVIARPHFGIVDRANLRVLLAENKLTISGLINPETAKVLGQIAGVDGIVTGTITPLGDSVRVSAKVIATDTATILAAARTDIARTRAIEDLLERGVQGGFASTTANAQSPALLTSTRPPGPAVGSARVGVLTFTLLSCSKAGRSVSCKGLITNKGTTTVHFELGAGTALIDDFGTKASRARMNIGGGSTTESLEPDVPMKFELSGQDISEQAKLITVVIEVPGYVLGLGFSATNNQKTTFKSIPLTDER